MGYDSTKSDEEYEKVPQRRCRALVEDDRSQWETGVHIEVPEFHGGLQPEMFLDWICTIEEVLDFKGVTEDKKVPLVATKLHDRATTWW